MKTGATIMFAAIMAFAPGALPAQAPVPVSGTISVEVHAAEGQTGTLSPPFVEAVDQELSARGFTIIEGEGHSRLVAEVTVTREQVGSVPAAVKRSGASGGPGGALGAIGAGVSLSLPTGKSTIVPLERTRLDIRIRQRDGNAALWQGSAITVRPTSTPKGKDTVVATDLTAAVLRAYPTLSESVISIP